MLRNALPLTVCLAATLCHSIPLEATKATTTSYPEHHVRQEPTATAAPISSDGMGIEYYTSTDIITIHGPVTKSDTTIPARTIVIAIPTCVQTITPDKNGYLPPGTCNALWTYYPSFGAAVLFTTAFGILLLGHIWQAFAYQKVRASLTYRNSKLISLQKFCWVIIMAALWETVAFTFRTLSTRRQHNANIYLVFEIFILLAPLCASDFRFSETKKSADTIKQGSTPLTICSWAASSNFSSQLTPFSRYQHLPSRWHLSRWIS